MNERTLLFTDIVDSTKVVQRLGDAAAATLWFEHDRLARALLAEHGGLEIDRSDGFLLLFDDVALAARFALGYHAAATGLHLAARVGIHHGPVTLRKNPPEAVARGAKPIEVDGLAKPLAARVMGLAAGGQTLLSGDAALVLQPALLPGQQLRNHGHYRLKGIEEPLMLFELGDKHCGFVPPADAEKAYRVVADGELWKPARDIRHNMPPEPDAFVGRSAELRALAYRLDSGARLLTLLGTGGTGKTRLARRYARAWLGEWPGGVAFCDLSEARSVEGIFYAVASALGVPLGKDDPVVQLGHAIAGRGRCLVILDNFEQLAAHADSTVTRWVQRAADATFVVTSREVLHVPGEQVFNVEPLLIDTEGVELFIARARARWSGFEVDASSRVAVRELVGLLDGLPLAIELAAARVPVLSPLQILERLNDRFALLARARGAAARQTTLRAAIDWSWNLLVPWEQAALAQCSVFEGGFTLEAAEAVLDLASTGGAPTVLDVVQALIDKSLLRTWVRPLQDRLDFNEPYFGMYVSIREFAQAKLDAISPPARDVAEARHGAYFARFGSEQALEALDRHSGGVRRQALINDLDNLVAACRRALGRVDTEVATATYRAAAAVLELRGPIAFSLGLGTEVLALASDSPVQTIATLVARARASERCGYTEEARVGFEQALAMARELHQRRWEGHALSNLGRLKQDWGRTEEALEHHEQALAIYRDLGERGAEGLVLGNLGIVHRDQSRGSDAQKCYEAALEIHRAVGNRRDEGHHPQQSREPARGTWPAG